MISSTPAKLKGADKPLRRIPEDRDCDFIAVAAQRLRGPDELERYGPQFPAPLFRDDQHAAHTASPLNSRMISARRCGLLRRVTLDQLCAALVRYVHTPHTRPRPGFADIAGGQAQIGQRQYLDGFCCGLLDAAQRCVARRIDAELDGQHRRALDLHFVQQAAFEFAPEYGAVRARCIAELAHHRGVRPIEERRRGNARGGEGLIG